MIKEEIQKWKSLWFGHVCGLNATQLPYMCLGGMCSAKKDTNQTSWQKQNEKNILRDQKHNLKEVRNVTKYGK